MAELVPMAVIERIEAAREAGLPYCPACGDVAHAPNECACQNMALGRCLCPAKGFEGGVPSYMTRVIPPAGGDPS